MPTAESASQPAAAEGRPATAAEFIASLRESNAAATRPQAKPEEAKAPSEPETAEKTAVAPPEEPPKADAPKAKPAAQKTGPLVPVAVEAAPKKAKPAKKKVHKAAKPKPERRKKRRNTLFQRFKRWFFDTRVARFIGQTLYTLGFYAECRVLQVWRGLREAGLFIGQMLALLFGRLGRSIASTLKSFGRDLASPFVRFRQNLTNLRETMAQDQQEGKKKGTRAIGYAAKGMKHYLGLFANLVGYILPVAAAGALVFTVYTLLDRQYVLAVEVNDTVIGYVRDELALEDAKSMLRGRIQVAGDLSSEDWSINPVYTIAPSSAVTTKTQLVDNILMATVDDPAAALVTATGLYINDELAAVTTEGERLAEFLDERLSVYQEQFPDAVVEFVENVDPRVDDKALFFASTVTPIDELLDTLSSYVSDEELYYVREGETLLQIAKRTGITMEQLVARNPEYEGAEEDFAPEAGTELLIRRAQPYLQVQTTYTRQEEEELDFEVQYVEDPQKLEGRETTMQVGQKGLQIATYDYVYIDGERQSRTLREGETVVVQEPVPAIIHVGTYKNVIPAPGEYSGSYGWPVPEYSYVSRGFGPGHRGLDIVAGTGTPIYASNTGVVVTANYHYSWGNHVVIEHPDGMQTLYAHCSELLVNEGDVVPQGYPIGLVGNTGRSFGSHLHLEVYVNGGLVDPYGYVSQP